jgi:hypothetical protein
MCSTDDLSLWTHGTGTSHSLRDAGTMFLPMRSSRSTMWTPKGTPSVPRGPDAMSPLCLSHRKALCLRKDDGRQYPVFIREGFVRQAVRAAPWMRIPSMRTTVSRWCVLSMYSNLWETTQALVRVRSVISIPSRPNRGVIPPPQPSSPAPLHAPLSRSVHMPRD